MCHIQTDGALFPADPGAPKVLSRNPKRFFFTASERKGNTLKNKDFYLKVKARIWPWLSRMCHIRSIAGGCVSAILLSGRHIRSTASLRRMAPSSPRTLAPRKCSGEITGALRSVLRGTFFFFFFTLVTGPSRPLRLKLSDTRVYGPQIRALMVCHAEARVRRSPFVRCIRCSRSKVGSVGKAPT